MHRIQWPQRGTVYWVVWFTSLAAVATVSHLTQIVPFPFSFALMGIMRFKFPLSQSTASPDARCGALCSLCSSRERGHCLGCASDRETRGYCPIFLCAEGKGTVCTECPEVLHCTVYRTYIDACPFHSPDMHAAVLPAGGFLVKEKHVDESLRFFVERVVHGDFGLMVMRETSNALSSLPVLKRVPRIQLCQTLTSGECVDPTNLARLHLTIEQFFKTVPRAVVLLEGVEYLIVHNGFDRVLKLFKNLTDCARENSSRFLTLVDPRVLEHEELQLLGAELTLIGGNTPLP